MAPCRRNPKGAGVFGPQALSFVGHDDKASFRSSFRACDPNTPARDPTDFHHGLLDPVQPIALVEDSNQGVVAGRESFIANDEVEWNVYSQRAALCVQGARSH